MVIAAVVGIYFHDLRNEVHPDHAYGIGEEKTVERGIDALKRQPLVAIKFALAVIGGSMIRGPLVDPGVWAAPLGGLVAALVAALGWLLWKTRNEPGRAAMAGIYAFSLYGIGSALLKWSASLDRMGYLQRPMLTSPSLNQFKAGKPISPRNAGLTQVFRNAVGEVTVNGYGLYNSSIAPDAILLARGPEGSQEWEGFHVVTYDLPSLRQARAMMTDQTFINYVFNLKAGRNPNFSRWSAVLSSKQLPEGRWELSAWGYDYTKNRIHPITGIFLWDKSPGRPERHPGFGKRSA
jgi:hypothetical protein